MGYLKISQLYKDQTILLFKECYALTKLDGTSAHIGLNSKGLYYFSGCVNMDVFKSLFNEQNLIQKFEELGYSVTSPYSVRVYGELIGAKVQGLSKRYGPTNSFVVFDVQVGDKWLSVLQAEDFAQKLGLEFVPYVRCSTDLDVLNAERDKDDEWAIKHGFGNHPSEGVVLRPLQEFTLNNGQRVIAKHKKDTERETKTPRVVDAEKQKVLDDAQEIAEEWVVAKRLEHVLQKVLVPLDTCNIPAIIRGMIEDIKVEGQGEIIWSKEVEKAIVAKTAKLVKDTLRLQLENHEKV